MILKKYFNQIYCINLDRRKDRWVETVNELKKWGLFEGVNRYPAVDGKDIKVDDLKINKGELGLIKTHLKIIRSAKQKKYKNILILEDDIEFTEEIINLENLMKYMPNDWDMLYLGGNHNTQIGKKLEIINEKVIKCSNTFTTHSIAIKYTVFDECIKLLMSLENPVDVLYTEIQKKYNCYSFYPNISLQRESYSDIQNKIEDNRWLFNL